MNAPPLPATPAELEAWQVYADDLEARGDPTHRRLQGDFALGARPTHAQVARFHVEVVTKEEHESRGIGWALGFARTLLLYGSSTVTSTEGLSRDELNRAALRLKRPTFSRVEALALRLDGRSMGSGWKRLGRAIPPSCTRLELDTKGLSDATLAGIAEHMPAHCAELECSTPALALFAELPKHVAFEFAGLTDAALLSSLKGALGARPVTLYRVTAEARALLGGWRLGRPGDAIVTNVETGISAALRRPSVREQQHNVGVIGIRAAIARAISEEHPLRAGPFNRLTLKRDTHGGWWLSENATKTALTPGAEFLADESLWSLELVPGEPAPITGRA